MSEKTFFVDTRLKTPEEFQRQVSTAVEEILSGEDIRVYCLDDDEYAAQFKDAVAKELASRNVMVNG
jgi:hypothetical protein